MAHIPEDEDRERQIVIDTIVGIIIVIMMGFLYYLIWMPIETDDDKMEGYGFSKVCGEVGYAKGHYPICIKEVWVLGHESIATGQATTDYLRKREAE